MFAYPVVPPVFLFGEDCGRRLFTQISGDGKIAGSGADYHDVVEDSCRGIGA